MTTSESTIVVNELTVRIFRKNIKRFNMSVCPPDGWIRVAAPEHFSDESIRLAVISRLGWIKRQIKSFEDQPRQSEREFTGRESHYYLGRRYLLYIVHTEKRPFVEIRNTNMLILNINENSEREERKKLLTDWYRQEMKRILPDIIKKWENKFNLKVSSYGIKRMKTKWGSCNPKHRRIWLNLELMKKPPYCIEYVVVHEIAHFLERHHNKRFFAHMDRIMPQWRTFKRELNGLPLAHERWKNHPDTAFH